MESRAGISIFTILGVAFLTLKLCGHIDWSWWWVLAPFWVPLSITLLIMAGILAVGIMSGNRSSSLSDLVGD